MVHASTLPVISTARVAANAATHRSCSLISPPTPLVPWSQQTAPLLSLFLLVRIHLVNRLTEESVRKLVYIKTNSLQLSDQLMQQHLEDVDSEEEEDNANQLMQLD